MDELRDIFGMAFLDQVLIVTTVLFVFPEPQRPMLHLAVQRPGGTELDQEEERNCEQEEHPDAVRTFHRYIRTRLLTNQRDRSYVYTVVSLLAAILLEDT